MRKILSVDAGAGAGVGVEIGVEVRCSEGTAVNISSCSNSRSYSDCRRGQKLQLRVRCRGRWGICCRAGR